MVKRMLVDANHPEETRVVVLDGTRLDEFDVETSTKKQNKGNIYLAKVVRVEPSLQAAFVDYGGERHGFLAFSEIHPDYYQIPVADREALLAEAREEGLADANDEENELEEDKESESSEGPGTIDPTPESEGGNIASDDKIESTVEPAEATPLIQNVPTISATDISVEDTTPANEEPVTSASPPASSEADITPAPETQGDIDTEPTQPSEPTSTANTEQPVDSATTQDPKDDSGDESEETPQVKGSVEELGGEDESEENLDAQRRKFVSSRRYKIQEVIKRRQILLVQVVKEERGNKGAALTTYMSLAGRYCVLMPNSSRGGGVSRKITNVKDRKRLKSILSDLNVSEQMAVILRTAGAERSKAEVKRDYEYLLRTWNQIRETTMESRAPALIHEEANLIKRSIRDVYSRDIEEVLVEGEDGYKAAKEFMKTLTPSHAKKVQRYKDDALPLFQRYQVESQLDAMHSPTVQLKSGGSIVFGQTEALVAIDVNSGRATKERHIEETALKTNLEAADEIARQLRLRDLAGLVVIDFIDMEENRNNHAVERRLKDALKSDRARIQVGRISHFGLLELSRQRLRPSLIETNFEVCKSCGGTGMIRSTESTSIQTLRLIEEEGLRQRSKELTVTVHPDVALYILNYKRAGLEDIQQRYGMEVFILGDSDLIPPDLRMERVKGDTGPRGATKDTRAESVEIDDDVETSPHSHDDDAQEQDGERKRRRRRRRRKKGDSQTPQDASAEPQSDVTETADGENQAEADGNQSAQENGEEGSERPKKGRRRGRRGGRRRRKRSSDEPGQENLDSQATDESQSDEDSADRTPSELSGPQSGSNSETVSEPLPAQPSHEADASTSSKFFSALKRGAEAFKSSANGSHGETADSKDTNNADSPTDSATEPDRTPSSESPAPAKEAPAEAAPAGDTSSTPPQESGEPKRGWWNQGE